MTQQKTSIPAAAAEIPAPDFDWFAYAKRMRPLSYGYLRNDSDVWSPLGKPLRECRIALISTGGVYRLDQPPFEVRKEGEGGPAVPEPMKQQGFDERGDWSCREIPGDTPARMLTVRHGRYDLAAARADINCVFPIDRLREAAAEGVIGAVAPVHFGLMGFIPDPAPLQRETIPAIVQRFKSDRVDAVVLAPG